MSFDFQRYVRVHPELVPEIDVSKLPITDCLMTFCNPDIHEWDNKTEVFEIRLLDIIAYPTTDRSVLLRGYGRGFNPNIPPKITKKYPTELDQESGRFLWPFFDNEEVAWRAIAQYMRKVAIPRMEGSLILAENVVERVGRAIHVNKAVLKGGYKAWRSGKGPEDY